jgi:AcrR family transcriptional regulator
MANSTIVTNQDFQISSSALRIVMTAERLFALHGIDGVSLRQIAIESGSANNSAVHYHFGSKNGLIQAIFRYRLSRIIEDRRLLLSRCDTSDLRSRFEAHNLPVFVLAEATDNHYVSFVEQLQRHELAFGPSLANLPEEGQRSNDEFYRDLELLLDHLDAPLRRLRISEAQKSCLHAAADRERSVASAPDVPPFELFVSSLFDGILGFLSAPASESTLGLMRPPQDAGERIRLL